MRTPGTYISAQTRREEHDCGLDSASFPAAMLYHFLHTPLFLSSLPNRHAAFFSPFSLCFHARLFSFLFPAKSKSWPWNASSAREESLSKRHTRRKWTPRRAQTFVYCPSSIVYIERYVITLLRSPLCKVRHIYPETYFIPRYLLINFLTRDIRIRKIIAILRFSLYKTRD